MELYPSTELKKAFEIAKVLPHVIKVEPKTQRIGNKGRKGIYSKVVVLYTGYHRGYPVSQQIYDLAYQLHSELVEA